MKQHKQHIDEIFKLQLGGYHEAPPAGAWDRIADALDDSKRRRGGARWWPRFFRHALFSALLLVLGYWAYNSLLRNRDTQSENAKTGVSSYETKNNNGHTGINNEGKKTSGNLLTGGENQNDKTKTENASAANKGNALNTGNNSNKGESALQKGSWEKTSANDASGESANASSVSAQGNTASPTQRGEKNKTNTETHKEQPPRKNETAKKPNANSGKLKDKVPAEGNNKSGDQASTKKAGSTTAATTKISDDANKTSRDKTATEKTEQQRVQEAIAKAEQAAAQEQTKPYLKVQENETSSGKNTEQQRVQEAIAKAEKEQEKPYLKVGQDENSSAAPPAKKVEQQEGVQAAIAKAEQMAALEQAKPYLRVQQDEDDSDDTSVEDTEQRRVQAAITKAQKTAEEQQEKPYLKAAQDGDGADSPGGASGGGGGGSGSEDDESSKKEKEKKKVNWNIGVNASYARSFSQDNSIHSLSFGPLVRFAISPNIKFETGVEAGTNWLQKSLSEKSGPYFDVTFQHTDSVDRSDTSTSLNQYAYFYHLEYDSVQIERTYNKTSQMLFGVPIIFSIQVYQNLWLKAGGHLGFGRSFTSTVQTIRTSSVFEDSAISPSTVPQQTWLQTMNNRYYPKGADISTAPTLSTVNAEMLFRVHARMGFRYEWKGWFIDAELRQPVYTSSALNDEQMRSWYNSTQFQFSIGRWLK